MNSSMKLNNLEVVRTVGDHPADTTNIRIRIPRLMPKIIHDTTIENFDNNIFVNDPKCKVYPQSTLMTQNYITVPKSPNCDLTHIIQIVDGERIIPDNSPLICACIYDTNKITVIDSY